MTTTTVETKLESARPTPEAPRMINWGRIWTYVILLAFTVLYLVPALLLINTSLKTLPEFFQDPIGIVTSLNFENFGSAWERANFSTYLLNTFFYTAVATAIFVFSTLFVAFPIARGYFKGSNWVLTLYVIALFLPPALIPQFQLILNLGLFNTRPGYILLFLVNPIGMIIMVNYLKSIPRELDESAAVDGASYFTFVWKIIFPLTKPAVATVTVLHAIGIWNEIVMPTIYLTSSDLFPITRGLIAFEGQYGSDWPGLAAAVLMLILPMAVLFLFMQRYIISGLTSGSVKG